MEGCRKVDGFVITQDSLLGLAALYMTEKREETLAQYRGKEEEREETHPPLDQVEGLGVASAEVLVPELYGLVHQYLGENPLL